jgi:hypothetical protein
VSQAVIQAVSKQPNTKSWSFCWLLAYYYKLACVELQKVRDLSQIVQTLVNKYIIYIIVKVLS